MDNQGDAAADGVWMTYGELAQARGVKRSTAIRFALRQQWRKQPGNDGLARVLVPTEMAKPADRVRDVRQAPTGDDPADVPLAHLAAFEAALAALREQQAHERAALEALREGHDRERAVLTERLADQCAQVAILQLEDRAPGAGGGGGSGAGALGTAPARMAPPERLSCAAFVRGQGASPSSRQRPAARPRVAR